MAASASIAGIVFRFLPGFLVWPSRDGAMRMRLSVPVFEYPAMTPVVENPEGIILRQTPLLKESGAR